MKRTELEPGDLNSVGEELRYDDSAQRAGRWARAVSILGFVAILTLTAVAGPVARKLGIPTPVYYVVAGATGLCILMLNWGIESMSKAVYRLVVVGFLLGVALLMIAAGIVAFTETPNLIAMAIFVGVYLLICLVTWRLKVAVDRA